MVPHPIPPQKTAMWPQPKAMSRRRILQHRKSIIAQPRGMCAKDVELAVDSAPKKVRLKPALGCVHTNRVKEVICLFFADFPVK